MALNKPSGLTSSRSYLEGAIVPEYIPQHVDYKQVWADAFALENTVVSTVNAIGRFSERTGEVEPGFDAFEGIEGTIFEEYPNALIGVYTQEGKIRAEMDLREEIARRERLMNAGALGFVASMAAGFLDPLILLPVGGQIGVATKIFAAGKAASRLAKLRKFGKLAATGKLDVGDVNPLTMGVMTARAGILGGTASEIVLQATQDTRTYGESAMNIAASTILSGFLGSGIGLLTRKSRRLALKELNDALSVESADATGMGSITLTEADLVNPTGGGPNGAEVKLLNALGAERLSALKGFKVAISPFVRVLVNSKSRAAKIAVLKLVDSPAKVEGLVEFRSSAEAEILSVNGLRFEMLEHGDRLYTEYRSRLAHERGAAGEIIKDGGRIRRASIGALDVITQRRRGTDIMSKREFMRKVGEASRSEDSGIAEIDELGRLWDERVYQPYLNELIGVELLDQGVRDLGTTGARRYLMRQYKTKELIARSKWFKDNKIRPWLTRVMKIGEAEAILKRAGLEPPPSSLRGLDDALDDVDAPEGLLSDIIDSLDAEQRAAIEAGIDVEVNSIFQNLTAATRGRIAYEKYQPSEGSPFKARALTWDDADVADFLEQDIELLGDHYLRSVVPDIAIKRQFGDVDLVGTIKEIEDEYAALIDNPALTGKQRNKLQKQLVEDKTQILGMAALLRGTYNIPVSNPLVTTGRLIRGINYLSMGGGFALNSIADIGMIPMRNGFLRAFRTGYLPYIARLNSTKLSIDELHIMGAAVDLSVSTRSRIAADVGNDFSNNLIEDGINAMGQKFSIINLLAPWNAMMKGISGNVTMTRMIQAIIREGSEKLPAREIRMLEFARLGPKIREQIRVQLIRENGMTKQGALSWSNTRAWTDIEAAQEFGRAVRFTVDNTILTPGAGAAPLWLSSELGATIFQFQRFAFGATNTLFIGAFQSKGLGESVATINGLAMMIALGSLVEWSKNELNGRPQMDSDDLVGWTVAGIDRSGALGAYGTAINVASRIFGQPHLSSRFAARNLMSSLLGPTLGTVESGASLSASAVKGELTAQQVHIFRRLLPFNQVPYIQWGFDTLETEATDALGIRSRETNQRRKRRRGQRR